jgi:thioredoxin-related protein
MVMRYCYNKLQYLENIAVLKLKGSSMKKVILLLLLVPFFGLADTNINWLDYDDARAQNSNKPIFVFGEFKFCSTCQAMKAEVFSQPAIADLLNKKFLPVKHTSFITGNHKFKDLKDKNGKPLKIVGSPAYVIITGDEYKLAYGYKSEEEMKKMLNYVLSQS